MRASAALGKATQGLFALVGTSLAGKSRDEASGKQFMGELQKPRQRACGDGPDGDSGAGEPLLSVWRPDGYEHGQFGAAVQVQRQGA